jgi:ankyrin repeat protein
MGNWISEWFRRRRLVRSTADIYWAIVHDDLARVEAMLRQDPKLANSRFAFRRTMLHEAVTWGNKKAVKLLVDSGAVADVADIDDCTPLHYAAASGRKDIAEILLTAGASVNAVCRVPRGHGLPVGTPLKFAIHGGHSEVAALLRAHGGVE